MDDENRAVVIRELETLRDKLRSLAIGPARGCALTAVLVCLEAISFGDHLEFEEYVAKFARTGTDAMERTGGTER